MNKIPSNCPYYGKQTMLPCRSECAWYNANTDDCQLNRATIKNNEEIIHKNNKEIIQLLDTAKYLLRGHKQNLNIQWSISKINQAIKLLNEL